MPTSYNYFKEQVKDWILDNISTSSRILDIGAGCGTYYDLLAPYGYELDAVEIWKPYIEEYNLTDKYKVVLEIDVMDIYPQAFSLYDFIIIGDILEHLTIEDGQKLINNLAKYSRKFLVAVPYNMPQNEYEGNKYEIHLQDDLTNKIMLERYPQLELLYKNDYYGYYITKIYKAERAYALYVDESYADLAQTCCNSIRLFSKLPIYVYCLNGNITTNGDDIWNIDWDCDIKPLVKRNEYIKREDKQIYKLLIERPKIVEHALKNYAKQVAYIDTDSIATEKIDSIFTHFDSDSIYPYFTEGIYEYLLINGRGGANSRDDLSGTLEAPACELFGINQYVRERYRQTGYFVAGQNCLDWLAEWAWMCQHPSIMRNNAWYAPFNEETIANCLLWKYNQQKGLPYCYINGLHHELEYKNHEYFLKDWVKVPLRENHLFYHGEKNINKLNKFNENIIPSATP